jgi:mannose-6-phosphate isomerase-like protein (cupin superfamily)
VHGLYLAAPFDNAIGGPSQTVTITGGRTTTVPLTVPYQLLGTASGTVRVTGNQQHIPITSYTVSACPVVASGSSPSPCIDEYSGPAGFGIGSSITSAAAHAKGAARSPVNLYDITTLTPGTWTLYPGYGTALGAYTDPVGTDVTIAAGQTTSRPLTVPFQAPTLGEVSGKVVVVGAPADGFESGVRACTAPPSGTSCAGELDAYSQANGAYSLALPPGTWWLSGFVEIFTGVGLGESTSAPKQVSVVPGSHRTLNVRVDVATS